HSVMIDDHEVFADLPTSMGGESSAPSPHDYFDAALGACKALTLRLYAQKKDIPLTGVTVEVKHDASEEQQGKYALHVKLTLKGVLTDAQRDELHRVADKCPLHKLMTTADVTIETHLSEGAFSQ
ncbi:OsmC family protein, partial [Pseudomonas psychrophila]